jgi:L-cysteine desulfidase
MEFDQNKYQNYVRILNEELVPAMGCTEPIAIAYCAALMKEALGNIPNKIVINVSGNIIKNVKSVTVPNTLGLCGIDTACAIGIIAGDASKKLEVIANVTKEKALLIPDFIKNKDISINHAENDHTLYIEIIGYYNNEYSKVIIEDAHTNVVLIEKNNEIIFKNDKEVVRKKVELDHSVLNIEDIIKFADIVNIDDVKEKLDLQIKYNMAIAEEGLKNKYGANIGKTILKYTTGSVIDKMKAYAAAGSDARMNGCDMPVVINSGSGNQGITASVPVIVFAKENKLSDELLYRALVVSNLCTIHIKHSIGKLSAFCGVVIAGAGCGAGVAYLEGGKFREVAHTLVNALAIVSGVVCDGAKSSCAAKIVSSVEAGILGYYMFKDGNQFVSGDGIIKKGVENTIKAIGELARVGMCETDKEIIELMIRK